MSDTRRSAAAAAVIAVRDTEGQVGGTESGESEAKTTAEHAVECKSSTMAALDALAEGSETFDAEFEGVEGKFETGSEITGIDPVLVGGRENCPGITEFGATDESGEEESGAKPGTVDAESGGEIGLESVAAAVCVSTSNLRRVECAACIICCTCTTLGKASTAGSSSAGSTDRTLWHLDAR